MTLPNDPTAKRSPPAIGPWRLFGWPCLVWLSGSLLSIAAWSWGVSGAAVAPFLLIGAICFAATVASLLPIRNLAARPADGLPLGLLVTVAIRGGITLSVLIGLVAFGWLDRDSVAAPIVAWYMAFLVTDLIVVTRVLSEAFPISARPHPERTTC